jgi:hypothetical protein
MYRILGEARLQLAVEVDLVSHLLGELFGGADDHIWSDLWSLDRGVGEGDLGDVVFQLSLEISRAPVGDEEVVLHLVHQHPLAEIGSVVGGESLELLPHLPVCLDFADAEEVLAGDDPASVDCLDCAASSLLGEGRLWLDWGLEELQDVRWVYVPDDSVQPVLL